MTAMPAGGGFMKSLFCISLFILVLLGASIPAIPVHADTGPKPTMDFQLNFESGMDLPRT
jgi:hypothetical protein